MKASCIKTIQAGAALVAMLAAQSAFADKEVSASIGLGMKINAIVNEEGCLNHPGPTITLGGEIALGTLGARVTFQNNAKGTHTATVSTTHDAVLLLGGTLQIPKQPVQGGVGGNPHILLQFHDGKGNDLSEEIYLGRCVQGLNVSADLLTEALARATIAGDCSNNPGPWITLGGDLTLSGLNARIIFENNLKGTHKTVRDAKDVVLIPNGSKIVIPKQPPLGGVGGNPIISFQFTDGEDPITKPVVLGRCVQL
jgi:hypothetical protein